MMLLVKKMDFEKSLNYYLKDKNTYEAKECHKNTYSTFYSNNEMLIRKRPKDFTYVTGLMTYDKDGIKVCVVHSWVEYCGLVIDVTPFANCNCPINIDDDSKEELENKCNEIIGYIQYSVMSNKKLDEKAKEMGMKAFMNKSYFDELTSNFLIELAEAVEKDSDFLSRVKDKYGYEFKKDGFSIGF